MMPGKTVNRTKTNLGSFFYIEMVASLDFDAFAIQDKEFLGTNGMLRDSEFDLRATKKNSVDSYQGIYYLLL